MGRAVLGRRYMHAVRDEALASRGRMSPFEDFFHRSHPERRRTAAAYDSCNERHKVLRPTLSAEHNIPSKRSDKGLVTSLMGSRSIRPDSFVSKNAIHSRPDECFHSLWKDFYCRRQ